MRKLIVLPGNCGLGGTTVSLSMMIRGFEQCDVSKQLCILVQSGSLMEQYLRHAGQDTCLQLIQAQKWPQFVNYALQWISKQSRDWPLLLENCVAREILPIIIKATPALRLSGRPIYHFFRDLALSHHNLGNLVRKFAFASLSPGAICNSRFTAEYIHRLAPEIQGILYPPVDIQKRFNTNHHIDSPPANLQPILDSGARIMLAPSRLSGPREFSDKNLRALIPVLVRLKISGHHYHGVIIGHDYSTGKLRTQALIEEAKHFGVADRFTVLPPTFSIEDYYKYADVVVTLALREPFGRTVVEAIACGVPVVGSQTGGIGEILRNFAPDWTVDPNDSIAAAEAIIRIAGDLNTPDILAKGRQWVETQCSPVEYAKKILKITGLNPYSH